MVNLDIATPMDYKEQIKNLGDPRIYFKILSRFEEMSLFQETNELVRYVNEKNYHEIKESVHKLKSTAGYVGASHIHYACYYMQDHFLKDEIESMMEYYPTLLEACVTFRVYSRKIIAMMNNQEYIIDPSHETIPMADGFRLVKDRGEYYVLF